MGVNHRVRRDAEQSAADQRFDLADGIRNALRAGDADDADQLARAVAWLADECRAGLVDITLMGWLSEDVTAAWQGGWQPIDLVRAARRGLGAPAGRMMADLIVAELRQYAPVTVDESWSRQLADVEANVWWPSDEQYFALWADRGRVSRHAAIAVAIDLASLFGRLPELPMLCPPPGRARRGSLCGHRLDERLLERVRALLAKAESTNFPQEAEAYTAKAQELMARHSIDYAMLSARGPHREEPGGRRIGIDNPYEEPKALLLDVAATANRCRGIWSRQLGFSTVVGYPSDVDAAELLFTSLLVQATSALQAAGSAADGRTASFRRSFLAGYAYRIADRLKLATASASAAAAGRHGGDMLPVLAQRADVVDTLIGKMFPDTVGRAAVATHRMGWVAGQRAADQARLGHDQAVLSGR